MPVDILSSPAEPLYTGDTAEHILRTIRATWARVHNVLTKATQEIRHQRDTKRPNNKINVGDLIFHKLIHPGVIRPKLSRAYEGPWRVITIKRNIVIAECPSTHKIHKVHPDTVKLAYQYYNAV